MTLVVARSDCSLEDSIRTIIGSSWTCDWAHVCACECEFISNVIHPPHVVSQSSRSQETLAKIDVFAHDLHNSLLSRNLSQIVDVIFVSDHGMADTSEVEWIYLDGDDILGTFLPLPRKSCLFPVLFFNCTGETWNNVTHRDGWPSFGIRLSEGTDERAVLEKLIRASNDPQFSSKFEVYTADSYAGGMDLCHNRSDLKKYELFFYRVP